jgi:hypothetical protein
MYNPCALPPTEELTMTPLQITILSCVVTALLSVGLTIAVLNYRNREKWTHYSMLLDDEAMRAVERLQSAYGYKTKADVYAKAAAVLAWAAQQHEEGAEFGRFDPKTGVFNELLLPPQATPADRPLH